MKSYYAIFFCLAITLHNLEEALWLPKWSQLDSSFQKTVTPNEFHFAVLIITALAYLVAFLYLNFLESNIFKWAYVGFMGSMIFNAIFPHLIATLLTKTYTPGLTTALLLNIPINTVILFKLHDLKLVSLKEIVLSTVVIGVILLAMIPLLFMLGGNLLNY